MNLILTVLGVLIAFALWLRWREPGMIYYPARDIDGTPAERGFLVLTDQYDPGWRATVDGISTRIYRTDYLFRGIPLPPGRHRVELTYRPSSMIYGAIGTLLGVVTIAVLFRFDRRRTPARS